MKSLVQKLCLVGLAVLIALPIAAQDKEKKKRKKGGMAGPVAALKKQLSELELTDDQKKKIDEIVAKHEPKISDAAEKAGDAPRKLNEARKKAKGEGKKGRELQEAAMAEANLTDDQKSAVEELEKHTGEMRREVAAVLTDEQQEKSGISAKGKKKKKDR